jgi:RimJ/RimL family protein N-acetyltransferase
MLAFETKVNAEDKKQTFDDKNIIVNTTVTIEKKADGLVVIAETPRLSIRPVEAGDVSFYQEKLWGAPIVLEKFADGKIRLYKDEASERDKKVNYAQNRIVDAELSWCNKWRDYNPWSGMTILEKKTGKKIGHIVIGGGELAYLFVEDVWRQGYGSEAVVAMTKVILPTLFLAGYTQYLPEQIEATTRLDHIASQTVLKRAGLATDGIVNHKTFGKEAFERFIFKANVAELVAYYKKVIAEKPEPVEAVKPAAIVPLYSNSLKAAAAAKEDDDTLKVVADSSPQESAKKPGTR